MQFQIYKMDPETHWELVMPDTSYTWLSAELLSYAHGNLPLGILFLLLFFGLLFVWSVLTPVCKVFWSIHRL